MRQIESVDMPPPRLDESPEEALTQEDTLGNRKDRVSPRDTPNWNDGAMHKNISRLPSNLTNLYPRIQGFLLDTLCQSEVSDDSYVDGSEKIDFYASKLDREHAFAIEEHIPPEGKRRLHDYEEALYERLVMHRDFNLLIYFGGLGSGKTTTIRYILRRFRERAKLLKSQFPCNAIKCFRSPLYLNFIELAPDKKDPITVVFRTLRLAVFEALVTEWLLENRNQVERISHADPKFFVLRRLLIANDLLRFHGGADVALAGLANSDLDLPQPLAATRMSDDEILALIEDRRSAAKDYEAQLRTITDHQDNSQSFMVLTLNYYISKCASNSPLNLIVIDNLDALPTPIVEATVLRLHEIATGAPNLPILIPLRPSSVNPAGFVRPILYRHHYGPNNFELVKDRLERHILSRSREQLIATRTAFSDTPSELEVDVMLIITYLYVLILESGMNGIRRRPPRINKHPDHVFLERVSVGPGARAGLAETTDALVGYCCRYALDLLRRYFENSYSTPSILSNIQTFSEHKGKTEFSYSILVYCLLRDPDGVEPDRRVANLFKPTIADTHLGWPTLSKLRILSSLSREKRLRISDLVRRLELYGIPGEITVGSLNSLQNKFRLLLWFSTNQPITWSNRELLEHDVVISEHGERYFKRMIGDFEYIWYCATALQRRPYTTDELRLTVKLDNYQRMIHQLGEIEWKQISFNRLQASCLPDTSGIGEAGQLEVLSVLYSSLGRALLGTSIALSVHSERKGLVSKLTPHIAQICELIAFWQHRYELAFRSNFYLSVYREEIERLRLEMLGLRLKDSDGLEDLLAMLHEVHNTWNLEETSLNAPMIIPLVRDELNQVDSDTIEKHDFGALSWTSELLDVLKGHGYLGGYATRFVSRRNDLIVLLSSSFPTWSEVNRHIRYLVDDLETIVRAGSVSGWTDSSISTWSIEELSKLIECRDILEANQFDVEEGCEKEDMSQLKRRANNILDVIERLARYYGIQDASHLTARWV